MSHSCLKLFIMMNVVHIVFRMRFTPFNLEHRACLYYETCYLFSFFFFLNNLLPMCNACSTVIMNFVHFPVPKPLHTKPPFLWIIFPSLCYLLNSYLTFKYLTYIVSSSRVAWSIHPVGIIFSCSSLIMGNLLGDGSHHIVCVNLLICLPKT